MMNTIQILKEKKKILSFEEICKEWSAHIARSGGFEKLIRNHNLQRFEAKTGFYALSSPSCCIVGESHGRMNEYGNFQNEEKYCEECYCFSMSSTPTMTFGS